MWPVRICVLCMFVLCVCFVCCSRLSFTRSFAALFASQTSDAQQEHAVFFTFWARFLSVSLSLSHSFHRCVSLCLFVSRSLSFSLPPLSLSLSFVFSLVLTRFAASLISTKHRTLLGVPGMRIAMFSRVCARPCTLYDHCHTRETLCIHWQYRWVWTKKPEKRERENKNKLCAKINKIDR